MTPPTPDLTALEQWAREELECLTAPDIKGDPDSIASLQSVLALCETVREMQSELTKWQTCSGCGETMDAPGHCSNAEAEWNKAQMEVAEQALNARDAAVARAERAERERDALMVRVDQLRRMADREVTACVEMRSDRDAARAEVAQARAERDEWQARATRAEIAQVEARMQDISERQAESVLQAIEDRGLVTWATERDILIRRAEQADATIATLRAELQAAQAEHRITLDAFAERSRIAEESERYLANELTATREQLQAAQAVPPLPEGWAYYQREDAWARTSHPDRKGQRYASVSLNDEGVVIEGDISPADLIAVIRHAIAQAHPTPAQEGQ